MAPKPRILPKVSALGLGLGPALMRLWHKEGLPASTCAPSATSSFQRLKSVAGLPVGALRAPL